MKLTIRRKELKFSELGNIPKYVPLLPLENYLCLKYQRRCTFLKVYNCILFTQTCFGHGCDHFQGFSSQENN